MPVQIFEQPSAATALFPLIVCGAALLIDEPRGAVKDNAPTQLGASMFRAPHRNPKP